MSWLNKGVRWAGITAEVAGLLTLLLALAPLAFKAGRHTYQEVARVTTRAYPAGYAGEPGPGWVEHSVHLDESLLAAVGGAALIAIGRGVRRLADRRE